jgi:cardiolipin synthase
MIVMHLSHSASLFTRDNRVELLVSAREKYRRLFEDIANAKESIHLIYFIIKPDNSGKKLVPCWRRRRPRASRSG